MSPARRPRRRSFGGLPGWAWVALGVGLVLVLAHPGAFAGLVVLAVVAGAAVAVRPSWRARLAGRVAPRQLAEAVRLAAQLDQARRERDQAVTGQRAALDQADAATRDRDGLAARLADVERQRAQLADQLAEARDAAHAAWDAAASRPVVPWECPSCQCLFERPGFDHEPCGTRRAEILADPRSGARPLVGE